MINKKIGVIGYGNMGGIIIYGAIQSGIIKPSDVYAFDVNPTALEKAKKDGVNIVESEVAVCEAADMVLLAVKPQFTPEVLEKVGAALDKKVILSIVAGITVERLKKLIKGEPRILRIMPNTPAMVKEGALVLCSDNDLEADEKDAAEAIFKSIGLVEWLPERLIDAVCGTSGGGPAWVAMFIEAMADGGVMEGLPRATAYRLVAQTVMGTAKMILETGKHPGVVKDEVTSPGGTTIKGCEALEKGGFRAAVIECVRKATKRSREL
ncbi:MAG: pyrroline-5-carboxylate reductase [Lachnospiraceae bacterium]|jgi:pyrroline-5-carboxylate reductase|nr:pyrroline-5-carboxylate reductase [Lachnospiraceae bacterium]